MEKPVVIFIFCSLGIVLLVVLYDFFTFSFADRNKRKNWPLMVLVMVLGLFVWLNPFHWPLESKAVLSGQWKGKAAAGKLVLYESGLFEITWNGWARDGLYHGKWTQQHDTICLLYAGKKLDRVGDTLLLQENMISPLNGYDDVFLKGVEFEVMEK